MCNSKAIITRPHDTIIIMKKTERAWDLLTDKERDYSIKELIAFFLDERNEELDIIGAHNLLDSFLQTIAPLVYNKAIEDTEILLQKQSENFDIELSLLKKNITS